MTKYALPLILTITGVALFPFAADAAPSPEKNDAETAKVAQLDTNRVIAVTQQTISAPLQQAKLALITPNTDSIVVKNESGMVFYNHYVAPADLTKLDYNVDVIDTYTYEHNGRTYTNKVVRAEAPTAK